MLTGDILRALSLNIRLSASISAVFQQARETFHSNCVELWGIISLRTEMPTGDVRGVRRMEAQGLGFPLVEPNGLAEICASLITIVQPYCPPHRAPLHKSNLTAE